MSQRVRAGAVQRAGSAPPEIVRLRRAAELPAEWEALRGEEQIGVARATLEAFEAAAIPGVSTRYLLALRGGGVAAGAALHRVAIDLGAQRFAWAEDLARRARDLGRPDLLRFRALMCGLNVSQGRDDVVSGAAPPSEEVVHAFADHAEAAADEQDLDGVVFGHLHPGRLAPFQALRRRGYVPLPSLGFATLPIRWRSLGAYLDSLRSSYRRQALADLARRDRAGVVPELDLDLEAHAEELLPLYLAVVERAEQRIETLNAPFFAALARAWRGQAGLVGLRRGGALVAGAVVVRTPSRLACLEVGIDYALRDEAGLYHALLLALVERACALGVERLDLGQTALEAKTRLGAEVVPTWLLVKARSPLVAASLRVERHHLRPEPVPVRHVFRLAPMPATPLTRVREERRERSDDPAASGGDWARYVNPELAAVLGLFRLDRTWVHGEGVRLRDVEGREAIDLAGGYGALPFGHNPQFLWDAVRRLSEADVPQLVQGSLAAAPGRLAAALVGIAPPGIRHVVFASSGAEAVEVAIKAARARRRRPLIVVAEHGFHGKTLGALSATSSRHYQAPFFAPAPGFCAVPYGDLAALERLLSERGDEIAAFLVEPIQGEGGVIVPPEGYLRAARELCARQGVLFLVDEVQTGLGRTGRLFATEDGLRPDAVVVSKALGGGIVPSAACLLSAEAWSEALALRHSSTFAGNALAATVGVAVLERLTGDGGALLAAVRRKGDALRGRLAELASRCPAIADVRGRGLMIGVEVGSLDDVDSPSLRQLAREKKLIPLLCSYLLERHGVRVLPPLARRTTLRLLPPLDTPDADLERAADALEDAFERLQAGDVRTLARHLVELPASARPLAPAPAPRLAPTPAPAPPHWLAARPKAPVGRFAFLIHALDLGNYRAFEPSLGAAGDGETAAFDRLLRDVVDAIEVSRVCVRSATGACCEGWFIAVPFTATGIVGMEPGHALRWVRAAVAMARERGADVVGLGAYTSIVTAGGARLRGSGVGLTTGNAYTVATAVEALGQGARQLGIDPSAATCAVVGASGSIGGAVAFAVAPSVRRLVLVGNAARRDARARLEATAAEIRRRTPAPPEISVELDPRAAVGEADLVVTATSTVGEVLRPEWFRRGAVVCDVAQPPDVSVDVLRAREDVLVLDGGVVALPEPITLGWDFRFARGHAYACMAETMLLALEGRREEAVGQRLDPARVAEMAALAAKHGFSLAGLRRGGRPIGAAEIARVRALCGRPAASSAGAGGKGEDP
jgi:acetylornithine/succinyldiaminopimelate/putrescine aminotransferase/predicted amino acid dehydrogenase